LAGSRSNRGVNTPSEGEKDLKRLIVLLFLLLLGSTGAVAQCIQTGGYPWLAQSCLHAADLNKLGSLFKGPAPPHNTNNLGALQGTLWEDDGVIPHVLRYCNVSACSPTYISTEWQTWGTIDSFGNLSLQITSGAITSSLGYVPLNPSNNLTEVVNKATARTNLGLNSAALQPSSVFLQGANNFSDVPDVGTARSNLGLGTAATHPLTDFLSPTANLSDLQNTALARTNLGIGSAGTLPSTSFLQGANNFSDVSSPATARTNLGVRPATDYTATVDEFGAKADNVTDSTTFVQTAINATPTGGTLKCSSRGTYYIGTPTQTTVLTTTGNISSGSNQLTSLAAVLGAVPGRIITMTGVPVGTYVLSASGTTITMSANATSTVTGGAVTFAAKQFLTLPHAINFGDGCNFRYANGDARTDVIRFYSSTTSDFQGLWFQNCSTTGTGVIRHDIELDMSTAINNNLMNWGVRYCTNIPGGVVYSGTGSGNPAQVGDAVHLTTAVVPLYTVRDGIIGPGNLFAGCVNLQNTLDGMTVAYNTFWYRSAGDTSCGLNLTGIAGAGAGKQRVIHNTSTANGGVIVGGVVSPIIEDNYLENTNTNTNTNNAVLDIRAGTIVQSSRVRDNIFQSVVSALGHTTLQLNNISGVVVGQTATGTNIPGGTTISAIGDVNHPWVQLSSVQTGPIANGATITINGVGKTTTQGAEINSQAVSNAAVDTFIDGNTFLNGLASPLVTNRTGSPVPSLQFGPSNYFASNQVKWTDFNSGSSFNTVLGEQVSTGTLTKTSNTTLDTYVPGLTQFLLAGATYNCRGHLNVDSSGAAGGIKVSAASFDTLTSSAYSFTATNTNGAVTNARSTTTSQGSAMGGATAVVTDVDIIGTITANVGGTLGILAAQNASSGTSTVVGLGSTFSCRRVS
jgi:hypothetical protein